MASTTINASPTVSPAALYLANLSAGSQGMRQPLDVIAKIFDADVDADSYPWHELTYRDTMAVRQALVARYKPGTVNKMLSALRGVLKQTWRLGLIEADAYHRAASVENVRASNLLSGRALEADEIGKLFGACAADETAKGVRDAAILAVLYGCGLRRGELVRLDLDDVDLEDGSARYGCQALLGRRYGCRRYGCQALLGRLRCNRRIANRCTPAKKVLGDMGARHFLVGDMGGRYGCWAIWVPGTSWALLGQHSRRVLARWSRELARGYSRAIDTEMTTIGRRRGWPRPRQSVAPCSPRSLAAAALPVGNPRGSVDESHKGLVGKDENARPYPKPVASTHTTD